MNARSPSARATSARRDADRPSGSALKCWLTTPPTSVNQISGSWGLGSAPARGAGRPAEEVPRPVGPRLAARAGGGKPRESGHARRVSAEPAAVRVNRPDQRAERAAAVAAAVHAIAIALDIPVEGVIPRRAHRLLGEVPGDDRALADAPGRERAKELPRPEAIY